MVLFMTAEKVQTRPFQELAHLKSVPAGIVEKKGRKPNAHGPIIHNSNCLRALRFPSSTSSLKPVSTKPSEVGNLTLADRFHPGHIIRYTYHWHCCLLRCFLVQR